MVLNLNVDSNLLFLEKVYELNYTNSKRIIDRLPYLLSHTKDIQRLDNTSVFNTSLELLHRIDTIKIHLKKYYGTVEDTDDVTSNKTPESDLREREGEINKEADGRISTIDLAESSPPEVQSTSVPLASTVGPAVSSLNYLSLKSIATPGDRGGREGSDGSSIMGMMEDCAKDVLDVTSSGLPVADLREAEGQLNREGSTPSGKTSSGEAVCKTKEGKGCSTGPRVEPESDLRELEGEVNRRAVCRTTSGGTPSGKTSVVSATECDGTLDLHLSLDSVCNSSSDDRNECINSFMYFKTLRQEYNLPLSISLDDVWSLDCINIDDGFISTMENYSGYNDDINIKLLYKLFIDLERLLLFIMELLNIEIYLLNKFDVMINNILNDLNELLLRTNMLLYDMKFNLKKYINKYSTIIYNYNKSLSKLNKLEKNLDDSIKKFSLNNGAATLKLGMMNDSIKKFSLNNGAATLNLDKMDDSIESINNVLKYCKCTGNGNNKTREKNYRLIMSLFNDSRDFIRYTNYIEQLSVVHYQYDITIDGIHKFDSDMINLLNDFKLNYPNNIYTLQQHSINHLVDYCILFLNVNVSLGNLFNAYIIEDGSSDDIGGGRGGSVEDTDDDRGSEGVSGKKVLNFCNFDISTKGELHFEGQCDESSSESRCDECPSENTSRPENSHPEGSHLPSSSLQSENIPTATNFPPSLHSENFPSSKNFPRYTRRKFLSSSLQSEKIPRSSLCSEHPSSLRSEGPSSFHSELRPSSLRSSIVPPSSELFSSLRSTIKRVYEYLRDVCYQMYRYHHNRFGKLSNCNSFKDYKIGNSSIYNFFIILMNHHKTQELHYYNLYNLISTIFPSSFIKKPHEHYFKRYSGVQPHDSDDRDELMIGIQDIIDGMIHSCIESSVLLCDECIGIYNDNDNWINILVPFIGTDELKQVKFLHDIKPINTSYTINELFKGIEMIVISNANYKEDKYNFSFKKGDYIHVKIAGCTPLWYGHVITNHSDDVGQNDGVCGVNYPNKNIINRWFPAKFIKFMDGHENYYPWYRLSNVNTITHLDVGGRVVMDDEKSGSTSNATNTINTSKIINTTNEINTPDVPCTTSTLPPPSSHLPPPSSFHSEYPSSSLHSELPSLRSEHPLPSSSKLLRSSLILSKLGLKAAVNHEIRCALVKKILLHGTMYITEDSIGFYSAFNDNNIFGYNTRVLISIYDVNLLILRPNKVLPYKMRIILKNGDEYIFYSLKNIKRIYNVLSKSIDELTPGSDLREAEGEGSDGSSIMGMMEDGAKDVLDVTSSGYDTSMIKYRVQLESYFGTLEPLPFIIFNDNINLKLSDFVHRFKSNIHHTSPICQTRLDNLAFDFKGDLDDVEFIWGDEEDGVKDENGVKDEGIQYQNRKLRYRFKINNNSSLKFIKSINGISNEDIKYALIGNKIFIYQSINNVDNLPFCKLFYTIFRITATKLEINNNPYINIRVECNVIFNKFTMFNNIITNEAIKKFNNAVKILCHDKYTRDNNNNISIKQDVIINDYHNYKKLIIIIGIGSILWYFKNLKFNPLYLIYNR